jgi:hypothetical protein
MALEKSLWQRVKKGGVALKLLGHRVMLTRIENMVDEGTPDVEGAINGQQIWAELKSCARPAKAKTPIRPKSRPSQSDWHRERTAAGSRHHYVLMQVGEASQAKLYLIPGREYDNIVAPEIDLEILSVLGYTTEPMTQVLLRAAAGW